MTKLKTQLYSREPDGEWEARKVFAGPNSGDWLVSHYDKKEPELEHMAVLVELEYKDEQSAFVRYAKPRVVDRVETGGDS